jgi:hypothetical protein
MTITFARRPFLGAGICGVVVLVPMFFLGRLIGEHVPPKGRTCAR